MLWVLRTAAQPRIQLQQLLFTTCYKYPVRKHNSSLTTELLCTVKYFSMALPGIALLNILHALEIQIFTPSLTNLSHMLPRWKITGARINSLLSISKLGLCLFSFSTRILCLLFSVISSSYKTTHGENPEAANAASPQKYNSIRTSVYLLQMAHYL